MRLLFVFFALTLVLQASSYEKWLKKQEASYSEFKTNHDQAFQESLKKDWEAFQSLYDSNRYKKPKPQVLPTINKAHELKKEIIDNSPLVELKQVSPTEKKRPFTKVPRIEKPFQKANTQTLRFDFYSNPIELTYDPYIRFIITQVNKNAIANFWERMSKVNNDDVLKQIDYYVQTLQLNDWASYLLVHRFAKELYGTSNMANLFTWYALTKMGYDVKVGYSLEKIYLLAFVEHKLFQVAFFNVNNQKYYLLTPQGKKEPISTLYTYKQRHSQANKALSFEFKKPILLNKHPKQKVLSFYYEQKKYHVTAQYSEELIQFYKTFPQSDYPIYLHAKNSDLIAQSLLVEFKPLLKGKTQIEAVNMLLRFVQTAFAYKTDQAQFSYEKVFFPEESFYYPYSDCEDRTILFNYLVKQLLNLNVLGVKYPDHMASAVELSPEVKLSGFVYQNRTYTLADATYINANVGMVMPKYTNQNFDIIP